VGGGGGGGGLKRKGNPPSEMGFEAILGQNATRISMLSFTCIFFCVQGFVHLSHSKNNFTSSAIFWSSLSCMPIMCVTHYKLQVMLPIWIKA